jgi:glycerol-3-phosphate dehydrogenase
LFEHDHAYIFQNADKRIAFAIPYERDFTLIGTTDVEWPAHRLNPADKAQIDATEVAYLCEQASRYFNRPVTPADVVWSYAGVRPLLDDAPGHPSASPSNVSRDYLLERNTRAAPLLSVWGGKITTYRKLAEDAADLVGQMLGHNRAAWTATAHLPGGDLPAGADPTRHTRRPDTDFAALLQTTLVRHPFLPAALGHRLCRAYGSRVERVMGNAESLADMGLEVAPGLYEAELRYLVREEWAQTAEDVLWRRSKLGLHFTQAQRQTVQDWFDHPPR